VIDNFWKILGHYQCTAFSGVPTLFSTLLNIPAEPGTLQQLDVATCGAAPLPVEVARQFEDKFGIRILEGYGLTEGTSVNSVNPRAGEARIGSVGLRFPYQEMRIGVVEGTDFVRFCEPEEVGVVLLRGPNVFPGYLDDFHNLGAFVDAGDGGAPWLNTGDMGREDADGYFWLTGRKKELIIRGGHNIDPKQIEEPLHHHPAVALAAAVGRPDAHAGELPVVYVELKPGQKVTEAELLAFAQEQIGERAAVPKQIYIIDAIPQTAVGKIFKPALSRAQIEDVFHDALSQIPGVAKATVTTEGDKRLGTVARVQVTPAAGADPAEVETAVRRALGQFTVRYELTLDT
jgi:fatty-acyl-CoA synthase